LPAGGGFPGYEEGMLYSYNWLKEYIEDPLPTPDELAEILTMTGT